MLAIFLLVLTPFETTTSQKQSKLRYCSLCFFFWCQNHSICPCFSHRPFQKITFFLIQQFSKKRQSATKHLCKRAVKWHQHIERDSGGRLWSKKLLTLRDGSWLQLRRDMHATVAQRNRTNTRAIHGHVAQRWQDSVNLVEARANQT